MRFERPFAQLPRRFCAETLAAEVAALPADAWIAHPGRLPGNDAVPLITPAGEITNAFVGAMAPTRHLRACPYIMEILADLGGVWGRSRLMGLAPGAVVPAHVDVGYYWRTHLRIHIPVVTNPGVSFTCDGETVHMAAGECWAFDSFRMHNVRNRGVDKRVHLVIDTVGSERLWDLIDAEQRGDSTEAEFIPPGTGKHREIAFEQVNAPEIMSSWEVRCHVDYLLAQLEPSEAKQAISQRLDRFVTGWGGVWAQFGSSPAGLDRYRALIDAIRTELRQLRADHLLLPNGVPLDRALGELVFQVATPAAAPALRLAAG